jgi:hypothetical protein
VTDFASSPIPEWERMLWDPEYALKAHEKEYSETVTSMEDLARRHFDEKFTNPFQFQRDMNFNLARLRDIRATMEDCRMTIENRKRH